MQPHRVIHCPTGSNTVNLKTAVRQFQKLNSIILRKLKLSGGPLNEGRKLCVNPRPSFGLQSKNGGRNAQIRRIRYHLTNHCTGNLLGG